MDYNKLIQPKEIKIGDRLFTISKIPALEAQSIYSALAKSVTDNGIIGMTMLPWEVNRQILKYVVFNDNGIHVSLDSDVMCNDTFAKDFGDMQQVILAMIKENFSFFVDGKLLNLLVEELQEPASVS